MVYRGSVKNGVVVLEGSPGLEEGTEVRVEPVESENSPPLGSPERILKTIAAGAHWQGDPEEVDRFLKDLKEMKREEVRREMEKDQPNPLDLD